jgi:hypothetical protein
MHPGEIIMHISKEQLAIRDKQWKLFNTWERSSQKTWVEEDPTRLMQWYSEAWAMARALNPEWGQDLRQEKILRWQKIRNNLSMLGETHESSRI